MSGDKQYAAVIFDWDGTLLDSAHHIVGALLGACRDLGLSEPTREQAGWVIGLSLQSALYRLFPDLPTPRMDEFVARYRTHFAALVGQICLFPGQAQLLRDLRARGVILGVATGKSRRGLDDALRRLELENLFAATRCADEAQSKPAPDMLEQLMLELDLAPESALMVGDTAHDVLMAKAAGIDSLAVTYGAHAPALLESAGPTALVHTVADMQAWLRRHACGADTAQPLVD